MSAGPEFRPPQPASSRRTRVRSERRAARPAGAPAGERPSGRAAEQTGQQTDQQAGRPETPEAPPVPMLTAPRDGLVPVIDRIQPLLAWCEAAAAAPAEPVAVDAERASSYRYSSRAYLVQLRTEAAGTALIDPVAFTMPPTLVRLLGEREWVLHAAGQDLPSLAEIGLRPPRLFDTELAARLLGMERVGLSAVIEELLGLRLAKEHSAADWSKRPLPESWLTYAALDVEVLVDVRDRLAARLEEAGKTQWAREEFEHERTREQPAPRSADWRSLHGIGQLRSARQLAAARAMWERRDEIARTEDLSPHRVIRDRDIVAAAKESLGTRDTFDKALPARLRKKDTWWQAARSGIELPSSHLPERNQPSSPPPHKLWAKKWPQTWERYQLVRIAVGARADELSVPTENLLNPSLLRQWVWEHETATDAQAVAEQLRALGARPWQAEIAAPVLVQAL